MHFADGTPMARIWCWRNAIRGATPWKYRSEGAERGGGGSKVPFAGRGSPVRKSKMAERRLFLPHSRCASPNFPIFAEQQDREYTYDESKWRGIPRANPHGNEKSYYNQCVMLAGEPGDAARRRGLGRLDGAALPVGLGLLPLPVSNVYVHARRLFAHLL